MKLVNEAVAINVVCELCVEFLSMLFLKVFCTLKNSKRIKQKLNPKPIQSDICLRGGITILFVKSDLKIIK